MSIHIALNHVTHYRYDRLVGLSPQVIRLRPAPHCRTRILSYSLQVRPTDHFINWQQDPQANYLARLVFADQTRELRIEVDLVAEMSVINPFDFFLTPYAETLANRSGSCRDSAALLVQLMRHMGLAARFVSGYLIQLVPDVKALDGPVGAKEDFTDLHAWCEVYLPGAGWIGLDPTSGLLAGEGHIPLACTPEPSAAAPISGAVDECETSFEHRMSVQRVWEAPRVTKPYSDAEWSAIETLGRAVDADLEAQDVRLTMGGEPTFVSIDDPDGAEWNTAALGPNKRRLAADLYHRLKTRYAPTGLAHFGQGKWYPGEQLPRWSLNCYWRKDGEPLWANPQLIADERTPYPVTEDTARRFLVRVAEELGLDPKFVFPAYEDAFYYLWRERRLPVNVDPLDSRLEDPMERARLAKIFEQGLGEVVGHVLPIARTAQGDRWQSGSWLLRSQRCYLVPGDSPIGYRLPLDSQPWVAKGDYPFIHAPDPSQSFSALPPHAEIRRQFREHDAARVQAAVEPPATADELPASAGELPPASLVERAPLPEESAAGIARTSLCAETRDGVLYIFMPPASELEHYVELAAAVEAAAEALAQPIILEGYEPPNDPRISNFRVTPDPGVIEVNVQPSADWDQLSERTSFLYEASRASRLSAEKFMLDGRHTGTGGGNHIVLGGANAPDSPFLRRPDLLRSLLSYWHNHPSLSYLFSGLFVGPTSQAPRVDEARNDSLYELEIAFRQFPNPGASVPPWLVDRLLRNLLIDVTGK